MTTTLFLMAAVALALAGAVPAVRQVWQLVSTVQETLPAANTPFGETGKTTITHSGLNVARTVDANSPVGTNVKLVSQGVITLTAGAATLNLAAAPGTSGAVDFTGQAIRTILFRADPTNVNPVTIAKGASNGYTGAGAAFSVTLSPGKSIAIECNGTLVAAGVRTLDITGTGAQLLDVIITSGDN